MTMFSMKPKFDLAKFLAEPAPRGSRAKGKRFTRQTAPAASTEDDADTTAAKE